MPDSGAVKNSSGGKRKLRIMNFFEGETEKTFTLSLLLALSVPLNTVLLVTPAKAEQSIPQNQTTPVQEHSLDLTSTSATHGANLEAPVAIQVGGSFDPHTGTVIGGTTSQILPGQMLTPAQALVVSQILSTGVQSLAISEAGHAVGGFANLHADNFQSLSSIIIPQNVSLNSIGFTTANPLSVLGSVNIAGALNTLQTAPNVASALNFGSLTISTGGSISGYLPTNFSLPANLFASQGLSINVAGTLTNMGGSITTPGTLNIVAGNIINQSTANMAALISAQNINISSISGNFANSGVISAVDTLSIQQARSLNNLLFNNEGGVLRSIAGAINIRDASFMEKLNTTFSGGDLLARELNIHGGNGEVSVAASDVSGLVNVTGAIIKVTASTEQLNLGQITATEDPLISNSLDVNLNASIATAGGPLSIIAGRNILATANNVSLNTSSTTGNGGHILLVAGADFSIAGGVLTINGGSASGGRINLNQSSSQDINVLSSRGSTSSGNSSGGNITLVAYQGSDASSGTINLPTAVTVTTGGRGTGSNGNFTAIAGSNSAGGNSLILGPINTSGTSSSKIGGAVSLTTGSPVINGGTLTIDTATGAVTAGSFSAAGILSDASISTRAITTDGGAVAIQAGRNILTNNTSITASKAAGNGGGGNVFLLARDGFIDLSNGGDIMTRGRNAASGSVTLHAGTTLRMDQINTTPAAGSANGGNVLITAGSSILRLGTINASGLGTTGNAGQINLISAEDITLTNSISANGKGTGNAGNINIMAGVSYSRSGGDLTLTGQSSTGGSIVRTGGTSISARATGSAGNGGNISLVATEGTTGSVSSGRISSLGAVSLDTRGAGGGAAGEVTILAGDNDAAGGTVIAIGAVTTAGGSGGITGQISLATANPLLTGGIVIDEVSGKITSGTITFDPGSLQNADISTKALTTNGKDITVSAGSDITTNNSAVAATRTAGAGTGGTISLNTIGGNITVGTGAVSSSGKNSSGGSILVEVSGDFTAGAITASAGTSGVGGKIAITTETGNIKTAAVTANGAGAAATGGEIALLSGGNISTSAVSATGSGTGKGGSALLQINGTGVLQVSGTLSVNGGSAGGGKASLVYNAGAGKVFTLGSLTGNSVSGSITATSTTGDGGSITITNANAHGSLTIKGTGASGITAAGSKTAGSITLLQPGSDVSVDLTGALTGAINATGKSVFLSSKANSNILTLGDVTATVGTVLAQGTGKNAQLRVQGNVTTPTTATLTGTGTGSILRTGADATISANSVVLRTGSGAIGSSVSPILTNTDSLSLTTTGSVFLTETDGVTVNSTKVANLNVSTTAGNIIAGGNLTGTSSITLNAGESIVTGGVFLLSAPTINLTAGDSIGSSGADVKTTATTLTANATAGSVFAIETNALTLGNSSAGVKFQLTAGGTITTAAGSTLTATVTSITVTGTNNDLNLGSTINASTSLSLEAADTITRTAGSLNGGSISLKAGGAIGSSAQNIQTSADHITINTKSAAFVTEADSITLGASNATTLQLTTLSGGSIAIAGNTSTTTGLTLNVGGSITNAGGYLLSSQTISLSSGDSIGDSSAMVKTTATNLTANSISGDAYLAETDAVSLGNSSAGSIFQLSAGGSISTVAGSALTAAVVDLTVNGAGNDLILNSSITGSKTISLSVADSITRTTGSLNGGEVSLQSGGTIGTALQVIHTNADSLKVSTPAAAFVTEANGIILNASTIGSLQLTSSAGGTIQIGDSVTATSGLTLISAGEITNAGSHTLTAPSLSMTASGAIGTPSNRIQTEVATLVLSSGQNAYVSEVDSINIGASTVGQLLEFSAGGTITTSGSISTTDGLLNASNIVINSNLAGGNTIKFVNGTDISISGSGTINAANVELTTTGGSASISLPIISGLLQGTAKGDFIAKTTVSGVSTGNITATEGEIVVVAAGTLSSSGELKAATQITLEAGSPLSLSGNLTAENTISIMSKSNASILGSLTSAGANVHLVSGGTLTILDGSSATARADIVMTAEGELRLGGVLGGNGAGVKLSAGVLTTEGESATLVLPEDSGVANGSISLTTTGPSDLVISDNSSLVSRGGAGAGPATAGSTELSSGGSILTGKDVAITARGGDVWMSATNDVVLGLHNSLTSLAKLSDGGGTFTTSNGSTLPNYAGGAIGIVAGYPALSVPAELQALVQQRSSANIIEVSPSITFNASSSNFSATGGSIFKAQGGAGVSIDPAAGNVYELSGGVMLVQAAPGRTINFNGARVSVAGPKLDPSPPAMEANQSSTASPKKTQEFNVAALNLTQFVNNGVATDRLNMNISLPASPAQQTLRLQYASDNIGKNSAQSPFFLEDSDSAFVIGLTGTSLSFQKGELNIEYGRLVVMPDSQPYTVRANERVITVNAQSASIIEIKNEQVTVTQLAGNTVVRTGAESYTAKSGEKLVIGSGQNGPVSRSTFDRRDLMASEKLLNFTEDGPAEAKERIDNLRSQIRKGDFTDAQPKELSKDHLSPVSLMQATRSKSTQALNTLRTTTSTVTQTGGTQMRVNGDNIELFRGEILLTTTRTTIVKQGSRQTTIEAGAIVQLKEFENTATVRTLFEDHANSVKSRQGRHALSVAAGAEMLSADSSTKLKDALAQEAIGRRSTKLIDLSDSKVAISDFSIPSAMLNSKILRMLYQQKDATSQKLNNKILKMAVCLQQVTSHRGPFLGTTD